MKNMVRIIAVTGGKGGTGKSTVAVSLAHELSKKEKVLLVDSDVDCPDDHLILGISRTHQRTVSQRIPKIDKESCKKCGICGSVCKTKAIVAIPEKDPFLIPEQCNGCGACKIACPNDSISWDKKIVGEIYKGKKDKLGLLSGEMRANEPVSEFIVNALNKDIGNIKDNFDYVIIDTAAGTHCPVIAAIKNAQTAIAVTEPTPLGHHDLNAILKILKKTGVRSKIVVNRSDLGNISQIKELSKLYDTKIALEIPFSKKIIDSYCNAEPIEIPNIISLVER